ncbi:MAG: phosphoribosylaminoimidazolesuccinocarboxamide synthase [Candidatus Pacebacteria bacterium]|nr:phosphoribosylaminoimidazolesuccinocarboxamide synthase [Candidatus Paceibacterota bacterium]
MELLTEANLPDCEIVNVGKVQIHVRSKIKNDKKKKERTAIFTDNISAGDERLGFGIKNKGKILLWLTIFFKTMFSHIVENDIVSIDQEYAMASAGINKVRRRFRNRVLLIEEVIQIPVECIARGYLVGSFYKAYLKAKLFVLGYILPEGMKEYDQLEKSLFTPSIKNKEGHDENVSYEELVVFLRKWLSQEENKHLKIDAQTLAQLLRSTTLAIFNEAKRFFLERDLILVDWKCEFGLCVDKNGEIILVWSDEGITPDTSRVWLKESYGEGKIPIGLDKDAVRKWVESHNGDKNVPMEIREKTAEAYMLFAEKILPEEYLKKITEEPLY